MYLNNFHCLIGGYNDSDDSSDYGIVSNNSHMGWIIGGAIFFVLLVVIIIVVVASASTKTTTSSIPAPTVAPKVNVPVVFGAFANGSSWYADTNLSTEPNFTVFPGGGVILIPSYSNGQVFAIGADNNLYYLSDYKTGTWVLIPSPGRLISLSFDGYNNIVVVVTVANTIFYSNTNITTNPSWISIPGSVKDISLSNNKLYAIGSDSNVYYASDYKAGNWIKIQTHGTYKNVTFDGYNNVVIVLHTDKNAYYANKDIYSDTVAPNWALCGSQLTYIKLSKGQLFGVVNGIILYNPDYTTPASWKVYPGTNTNTLSFEVPK